MQPAVPPIQRSPSPPPDKRLRLAGALASPWLNATLLLPSGALLALEYVSEEHRAALEPVAARLGLLVAAGTAVHLLGRLAVARARAPRWPWLDAVLACLLALLWLVHGSRVGVAAAAAWNVWVAVRALAARGRPAALVERLLARPARLLAATFLLTIAAGTAILAAPASTADGRGAPLLVALFTATSAACVTGLTVVDTGTYFSPFGHWVILGLIQVGGLGIMTLTSSFALALGGRLSPRMRGAMLEILDEQTLTGVRRLIGTIVLSSLAFEAAGAVLLYLRLDVDAAGIPLQAGRRAFYAAFHAVSALCNAGFSLYPDSLARFGGSGLVNGTVCALVVLGGLGFPVLLEIAGKLRSSGPGPTSRRRLSAHSKIVLLTSLVLVAGGTLAVLGLEWSRSLEGLPRGQKLMASAFLSVNLRTAGFTTVDLASLGPAATLVGVVAMFIGGSPSSMAGGVKTSTVATLFLSVRALVARRREVEVFDRTIGARTIQRAMAVLALSSATVFGATIVLSALEPSLPLGSALFEATSAFATAGLSTGATAGLGAASRVLLVVLMFVGRLGPVSVALAVRNAPPADYAYPSARVLVG